MILDVRLPDIDGLAVCRSARRAGHRMPILMLTALDRVGDRVIGLDAGADDYLAKPFAIEELLARLRALSRRITDPGHTLEVGPLLLDVHTREVTLGGRPVDLTAREFELLAFLMHAPGRVFTREQIYEGVWGYSYLGDSKVIDFFVSSLRKKLGAETDGSLIRTVRGVGLHRQTMSFRARLTLLFVTTMTALVVATSDCHLSDRPVEPGAERSQATHWRWRRAPRRSRTSTKCRSTG